MSDSEEPRPAEPGETPDLAPTGDRPRPAPPAEPESAGSDAIPWADEFLWPDRRTDAVADPAELRTLAFTRAALGATLLVVLALLIWTGRTPPSDELPTDLRGRWTTTTAPYSGRGFVISLGEIGFDRGDGNWARYPVSRVVHERSGNLNRYRITYRVEGGDAQLDVEHDRAARTLRMTSRPRVIWRR